MTSFLFKFVINPIGVWFSAIFFTGLYYDNWTQPVILGLILAVAGVALEYMFLRRGTLWVTTVLDWGATTMLVYMITPMFHNAGATFLASLSTGLLFTFIEYFLHRFLISTGLTRKRART